MMKKAMKLPAALGLLALMIFPASESAAMQACMKAVFGVGYVSKFRAAWGLEGWDEFQSAVREKRPFNVDGVTGWSGDVHLVKTRCIGLDHLPAGSSFTIQLKAAGGGRTMCKYFDEDNAAHFERTTIPERQTLWLQAWGPSGNPQCKMWKFHN